MPYGKRLPCATASTPGACRSRRRAGYRAGRRPVRWPAAPSSPPSGLQCAGPLALPVGQGARRWGQQRVPLRLMGLGVSSCNKCGWLVAVADQRPAYKLFLPSRRFLYECSSKHGGALITAGCLTRCRRANVAHRARAKTYLRQPSIASHFSRAKTSGRTPYDIFPRKSS